MGLVSSVTTVAAIALGLGQYDSEAIHHSRIPLAKVREITDMLLSSTHAERAAIPVMHPGRVDVIAAGALVLLSIMERTGAGEVVVSEHDILDGIAWSLMRLRLFGVRRRPATGLCRVAFRAVGPPVRAPFGGRREVPRTGPRRKFVKSFT